MPSCAKKPLPGILAEQLPGRKRSKEAFDSSVAVLNHTHFPCNEKTTQVHQAVHRRVHREKVDVDDENWNLPDVSTLLFR